MPAPISQFENASAEDVGNTLTDLFTATDDCYFIQLDISAPETSGIQYDVYLYRAGPASTTKWIRKSPLPVGSTVQLLEGTKLVLKTGDKIQVRCATAGETIDVFGSYVDKVNL